MSKVCADESYVFLLIFRLQIATLAFIHWLIASNTSNQKRKNKSMLICLCNARDICKCLCLHCVTLCFELLKCGTNTYSVLSLFTYACTLWPSKWYPCYCDELVYFHRVCWSVVLIFWLKCNEMRTKFQNLLHCSERSFDSWPSVPPGNQASATPMVMINCGYFLVYFWLNFLCVYQTQPEKHNN